MRQRWRELQLQLRGFHASLVQSQPSPIRRTRRRFLNEGLLFGGQSHLRRRLAMVGEERSTQRIGSRVLRRVGFVSGQIWRVWPLAQLLNHR